MNWLLPKEPSSKYHCTGLEGSKMNSGAIADFHVIYTETPVFIQGTGSAQLTRFGNFNYHPAGLGLG